MDINSILKQLEQSKRPPVEQWNPPFCGDIDIEIKGDGTWFYQGSPIGRKAIVKLFASVLTTEKGDFFLVTPAEKVRIKVEECPFVMVLVERAEKDNQTALIFTDNLGDQYIAGSENNIWVEDKNGEPRPYLSVHRGLTALINRNVFYQLVNWANEYQQDGRHILTINSMGAEFVLGEY